MTRHWLPVTFVFLAALMFLAVSQKLGEAKSLLFSAAVLLALLVTAGARRPALMVSGMVVFVPLQTAILAFLYSSGFPNAAIRGMGLLKEAAVAAVVLAAIQRSARGRRSAVVAMASAYLALVTLFLLLPVFVSGVLYDFPLGVRLLAWRSEGLGLLALVALANLRLPRKALEQVCLCVIVTGVILGAGAIWQVSLPKSFDSFGQTFLHIAQFRRDVLGTNDSTLSSLTLVTVQSGMTTIRAGSFLFEPLTLAFYLLIPFSLLCARATVRYRPWELASLGVVAAGLLATSTRSAVFAAGGSAIVVLLASKGAARARATSALGMLGLLLGGSLGASFIRRVSDAKSGQDYSTLEHKNRTRLAYQAFLDNPLGRGLGVSPGSGIRSQTAGSLTAENAYLAVALETGAIGLLLFVGVLGASMVSMGRGASEDVCRRGLIAAGAGLAVSGLFLHTWAPFAVSLTYWPLIGVALGVALTTEAPDPDHPPETDTSAHTGENLVPHLP